MYIKQETRKSLKLLLNNGEVQVQASLNEQLINRTMSIDAPIKKRTTINYQEPLKMWLKQKRRN